MSYQLTGREKNMIIGAVTIVFCALFAVYLIVPQWAKYSNTKVELNKTLAGLAKLTESGKAANSMNLNIEKVKGELSELGRKLPTTANTSELLFYLNRAAEKAGVVLENFESSTPDAKTLAQNTETGISPIYSKVRVTGTYAQIRNFVSQAEGMTRLTYIRAVTVSEVTGMPNTLEGIVELAAFVAKSSSGDIKSDSDIPKAMQSRPSPFKY